MNNDRITRYIEAGKKANKEAVMQNNEFYDLLDKVDLTDPLDIVLLQNSKSSASASNTNSNRIRTLITKTVNAELKALKENK